MRACRRIYLLLLPFLCASITAVVFAVCVLLYLRDGGAATITPSHSKPPATRPYRRHVACHMSSMSSKEIPRVAPVAADGTHAKLRRGIRISTRCDMMEKSNGKERVSPTNSTKIYFLHPSCYPRDNLEGVGAALQTMYAAIRKLVRAPAAMLNAP